GNAARGVAGPPAIRPKNFYLTPGTYALKDMVRSVKRGFYVTELIGFGVNAVTGDYSRGAAGMWIEDGELAYPVEEVTIAGRLPEMLKAIAMIGSEIEFRGAIAAPPVLVEGLTVAGL
ncbi:MAG: metallopeptidase TldD-related protein, partial [Terriglobia bacterium]